MRIEAHRLVSGGAFEEEESHRAGGGRGKLRLLQEEEPGSVRGTEVKKDKQRKKRKGRLWKEIKT